MAYSHNRPSFWHSKRWEEKDRLEKLHWESSGRLVYVCGSSVHVMGKEFNAAARRSETAGLEALKRNDT